jgi:hypothetical protein
MRDSGDLKAARNFRLKVGLRRGIVVMKATF